MTIFPILIILCGFLFGILQVTGVINFKKSQMTTSWLVSVAIFILLLVLVGLNSSASATDKAIYLYVLSVAVWCNILKFSFGLVQKNEKTLYNRFEHFATGLLLFYGLNLIKFVDYFPITFHSTSAVALFILLIVNMVSVGIEMGELLVDLCMGRNYMIGPGVHDTNWDLTLTFLGSLAGYFLFS